MVSFLQYVILNQNSGTPCVCIYIYMYIYIYIHNLVHLMIGRKLYSSDGKESACSVGDPGSMPGLGRSPGGGHGNPLQCSCLENHMDIGAWRATVHGVTESDTAERLTLSLSGKLSKWKQKHHYFSKNPRLLSSYKLPLPPQGSQGTVMKVSLSPTRKLLQQTWSGDGSCF